MKTVRKAKQEVGVVIVNWNTRDFLHRSLTSFVNDGVPADRIVVVDQGSSDGSVAHVRKHFAGATIVLLPENRSYAAAINAGAARLTTTYLVLANADVEFGKGTIERLTAVLKGDANNGLVGPFLRDADGSPATRFSRTGALRAVLMLMFPSYVRGWWKATEGRYNKSDRPTSVRWVEGSFMVIHRKAFDEAGGFDEEFSFYFEDGDFSLRLRELGYALFHCPTVSVTHYGGASLSQAPDRARLEFYKNCLLFYRKHLYRRYVWLRRSLRLVLFLRLIPARFGSTGSGTSGPRALRGLLDQERHATEQRTPRLSQKPLVSVIVPTYERVDCLLRLLNGIKHQSYRDFEVIIVDQSKSMDARKEHRFRAFGRKLRVLRTKRANRSFAKNLGTRIAKGEILLFCDDDVEVPADLLQTHVSAYSDDSVGAVSCRLTEEGLPPLKTRRILRITAYGQMVVGFQSDVTCFVNTLVGGNMSVLRSVWETVGEFDPTYGGTSVFEEPDFSARVMRTGRKILFTNRTSVTHVPHPDGSARVKSNRAPWYYHWFHRNEILYFLKNRSRLNLFMVIPFCLLRTVKQSLKFRMKFIESTFVLKGILEGFKTYYRIYS
jgi:GT2 family glycosyltransferase